MPLDLVGQVPAQINGSIVVTITNLSSRKATPTVVKKGALGPIGTAQGIPDVTGSFRLAQPKTGIEVNMEALAAQPGGFVITYTLGTNRYADVGCVIAEADLSVDNGSGNVEWTVNYTATERVRLA